MMRHCFSPSKSRMPLKRLGLALVLHRACSGSAIYPTVFHCSAAEQAGKHSQGPGTLISKTGCKAKSRMSEVTKLIEDHASNSKTSSPVQECCWQWVEYGGETEEQWRQGRWWQFLLALHGACAMKRWIRAALWTRRSFSPIKEKNRGEYSCLPLGLKFSSLTLQSEARSMPSNERCFSFIIIFISRCLIFAGFLPWNFVAAQQGWTFRGSPKSPQDASETESCCRAAVRCLSRFSG